LQLTTSQKTFKALAIGCIGETPPGTAWRHRINVTIGYTVEYRSAANGEQ